MAVARTGRAGSADALEVQAAQWIVQLTDDDQPACAAAAAGFAAWKAADPRHAAAAAGMEQLLAQLDGLREQAGGSMGPAGAGLAAAVARPPARARRHAVLARTLVPGLAVALALAVPAWLALQHCTPAYLLADIRVAGGHWETHTLADGSRLTLGGGSAVNVRYDGAYRVVELVQGDMLVDVAKDAQRPFVVQTAQGSVRALGTRFTVSLAASSAEAEAEAVAENAAPHQAGAAAGTMLSMLESRVEARAALAVPTAAPTIVEAGERVRIAATGVGPVEDVDPAAISDAWRLHQLVVDNQPLSSVLDQLDRQRPGRIVFSRAALDGIRVSAVLPLDDTDRALNLLLTNFPQLRIRSVSRYLVLVDVPKK